MTPERQVLIWDGIEYRNVPQSEADKLVKEDKAQDLSKRIHSALDLRFRRDFTGYHTREMRAKTAPEPKVAAPKAARTKPVLAHKPVKPEPKAQPKAPEPKKAEPKKPETPAVLAADWQKYKKDASVALGKPWNKTTKADTIAYMEKHLGLET